MNQLSMFKSSRWLTIVRLLVVVFMIYNLATLIITLPVKYGSLGSLTPGALAYTPFNGWTSQQMQDTAMGLGIRPEIITGAQLTASLICLFSFWMMAGVLIWRKSDTWTGLLAAYLLFFTGPGFSGLLMSASRASAWAKNLDNLLAVVTWPTFFLILFIFPSGKFVPRFTRYLIVIPYLLFILAAFDPRIAENGTAILFVYALGGLASQVYRYVRVSSREERQQIKWVVFALAVVILLAFSSPVFLSFSPGWVIGSPQRFWYEFIGNGVIGILIPALLPLALGISIMRYHLWNIDLIIRRTLSYTLVTGTLALVYFGSVSLLQILFVRVSGQQSPVSIVISTLLTAALFTTVRRQVQDRIDRRFNRQKYNSREILERFAAHARDEVELDQLRNHLLAAVQESIQPEQVSLWVRQPSAASSARRQK